MNKFILGTAFTLSLMTATPALASTIHIGVNGLVCDFCARAIEKVFMEEAGVTAIKVDLTEKLITLDLADDADFSDEKIRELVTDSGYDVKNIHRME